MVKTVHHRTILTEHGHPGARCDPSLVIQNPTRLTTEEDKVTCGRCRAIIEHRVKALGNGRFISVVKENNHGN